MTPSDNLLVFLLATHVQLSNLRTSQSIFYVIKLILTFFYVFIRIYCAIITYLYYVKNT